MSSVQLSSPFTQHTSRPTGPAEIAPVSPDEVLAPVVAAAGESTSLIASRQPFTARGETLEIPKFLLLGQRGSGQPIRLGLFAGFEPGQINTVQALSQLLLLLKKSPGQSRDYAFIAYPVVNVRGFATEAAPLADFEGRFARDSAEGDVQFFKSELLKWNFNGLISLRTDVGSRGFHAAVRSELIAREVVEPALAAAAGALPLAVQAVKVRPGDRYARTADYSHGRLAPPAEVRPYPFEIELFLPRTPLSEKQGDGLFVALTEILRLYRALLAHGQDL